MFNFLGAARRAGMGGAGLLGGLSRGPMNQQSPGMGGSLFRRPMMQQNNPIGGFTGAKSMFPQPSIDMQQQPVLGGPSPEFFDRMMQSMNQGGTRILGGARNMPMGGNFY